MGIQLIKIFFTHLAQMVHSKSSLLDTISMCHIHSFIHKISISQSGHQEDY